MDYHTVPCQDCSAELRVPLSGRGKSRRFCNGLCQTRAWKKANAERHALVCAEILKRASEAIASQKPTCRYCPDQIPLGHKFLCGKTACQRLQRSAVQRAARERYKAEHGRSYDPESKKAARHLRRARKRTDDVELFKPVEIYERDGWMCGICGESVDPGLRYPDPMSASLDHVIALSRGGRHRRENVQCSHHQCNLKKNDSMAA